jgi:hypothetical protein
MVNKDTKSKLTVNESRLFRKQISITTEIGVLHFHVFIVSSPVIVVYGAPRVAFFNSSLCQAKATQKKTGRKATLSIFINLTLHYG